MNEYANSPIAYAAKLPAIGISALEAGDGALGGAEVRPDMTRDDCTRYR